MQRGEWRRRNGVLWWESMFPRWWVCCVLGRLLCLANGVWQASFAVSFSSPSLVLHSHFLQCNSMVICLQWWITDCCLKKSCSNHVVCLLHVCCVCVCVKRRIGGLPSQWWAKELVSMEVWIANAFLCAMLTFSSCVSAREAVWLGWWCHVNGIYSYKDICLPLHFLPLLIASLIPVLCL